MTKAKLQIRLFVAGGLCTLGLALAPWWSGSAAARQGEDNSNSNSSNSSISGLATGPKVSETQPATIPETEKSGSSAGTEGDSSGRQSEVLKKAMQDAQKAKEDAAKRLAEAKDQAEKVRAEVKDKAAEKLSGKKLDLCKTRENNITDIMNGLGSRGQRQLVLFTTISERVQAFYTAKNISLSNYDTLVADIDASKTAAQTAVDKVIADKATFKCDGTNPTGAANLFKADVKTMNEALKAYRSSVKSLISAVKTAADGSTNPSPTPALNPSPSTEPNPQPNPSTGGSL